MATVAKAMVPFAPGPFLMCARARLHNRLVCVQFSYCLGLLVPILTGYRTLP